MVRCYLIVVSNCHHSIFSSKVSTDNITVYDALEQGFDDLMGLCDVVIDKFTAARDEFNADLENATNAQLADA